MVNSHVKINELLNQHELFHSVMIDEDYLIVRTHVDDTTRRKIIQGEYVDFSKLIPKGRVSVEDDHHMEMVNYDGHMFWVPAADKNSVSINCFSRWEQAFHVYSNIYTKQFPNQSSELIQYNHVIYTASLSFVWDNVYQYDKEFHLHLSRHPARSWSVILQQAWTMYMKDRVPSHSENHSGGRTGSKPRSKKICFDFNAGACQYRQRCRFEHRCGFCNKFGHGTYNCRKAKGKFSNFSGEQYDRKDRDGKRGQPNDRDRKDVPA